MGRVGMGQCPIPTERKNPLQKRRFRAFSARDVFLEVMWYVAPNAVKSAFKRGLSGDPVCVCVCVCVCKYRAIVVKFTVLISVFRRGKVGDNFWILQGEVC